MSAKRSATPKPEWATNGYLGSWQAAVKRGDVSEQPDADHPIATQAPGNPKPLYVTRAFVEARFGSIVAQHADPAKSLAERMAKLDAGEKVPGVTADYWLAR